MSKSSINYYTGIVVEVIDPVLYQIKVDIPGINKQDIKNIPIYSPNNEIVKHFGDVVLPLIKQILFNCKESRRLASLRDTLLPRLMSGELKVNEVI